MKFTGLEMTIKPKICPGCPPCYIIVFKFNKALYSFMLFNINYIFYVKLLFSKTYQHMFTLVFSRSEFKFLQYMHFFER